MKGQSDTKPNNFLSSVGKTQILYNIISEQIIDEYGTRTIWKYDYIEIDGIVTKSKIVDALKVLDNEIDNSEIIADNIYIEYNDSKTQLSLSEISHMTYSQLDNYIETNITTLSNAKTYLKKLSRVALALVKKYND